MDADEFRLKPEMRQQIITICVYLRQKVNMTDKTLELPVIL
jgi:hypothetical protein